MDLAQGYTCTSSERVQDEPQSVMYNMALVKRSI